MSLPVELFLALRYLRPRRTFVSIITVLSLLGVTLGVMVLIVVLSVMGGLRDNLNARIIGFNAHITVTNGDIIYGADKIIDSIKKLPDVVAVSPTIQGGVLVQHEGRITTAIIKSAPTDREDPVLPLKHFLVAGEFELRGDSVVVGKEWARANAVFPGDKLDIFGPAMADAYIHQRDKNQTIVMPDEPIVRGIFQTGQFSYDDNYIIVSTTLGQHLYGISQDGCQSISIRLKDPGQAAVVRDQINDLLPPPFLARTWMDDYRDLYNAIATERVVMTFILFFVMLVAAFGLCSTLITITVQKSREIGLMKALGANDLQVCGVFLFHGVVVGVVGSLLGTMCGLVTLHFRNPFRLFLMHSFHIDVFPGSVYMLTEIPAVINPQEVTSIAIAAVAICVLAALLPAISAARLAPARALRYE